MHIEYHIINRIVSHSGYGNIPIIKFYKNTSVYGLVLIDICWRKHHFYITKKSVNEHI